MKGRNRNRAVGFQEWETPPALFAKLHREFRFTIDLAASHKNRLVRRFFSERDDALNQSWEDERGFVNPPFKLTRRFVMKASAMKRGGYRGAGPREHRHRVVG